MDIYSIFNDSMLNKHLRSTIKDEGDEIFGSGESFLKNSFVFRRYINKGGEIDDEFGVHFSTEANQGYSEDVYSFDMSGALNRIFIKQEKELCVAFFGGPHDSLARLSHNQLVQLEKNNFDEETAHIIFQEALISSTQSPS